MDQGAHDGLPTADDVATVRQWIMGFRLTQLLYVTATLRLADHLQAGPHSPQQLAHTVGVHPQALYRLLRALASVGIFVEQADGTFARGCW